MRYANAFIKEYPNSDFVQVAVFNRIITDEFTQHIRPERLPDEDRTEKHVSECERISRERAKNKIFDIALMNVWQYFVTFTFNDKLVNAYDYDESIKKVKKWCSNAVQRVSMRYLLVPELHPSSGRIHLHGLLYFPVEPALQFSGHWDKSGRLIYNLPMWKYGFSTVVRIDDNTQDRIAKYITKYITKDIQKITGNMYYAGGVGLVRDCEKEYINVDYDNFTGFEVDIIQNFKVKYLLMSKEQSLMLQFIVDNDLNI